MKAFVAIICCLLLAFPAGATNTLMGRTFPGARGGAVTVPTSVITPGVTAFGSWAATAQPANQGSGGDYGYNDNAIGVWDTVPFQTFTANSSICVAAYHVPTAAQYAAAVVNNISKVSFAINGGSFVDVSTLTTNPVSGQLEYCALVRPSDFAADGQFEARAIIYPTTGVPLVLQGTASPGTSTTSPSVTSLVANVNATATLPAVQAYVATTGTDTGNCQTAGSPCLTISYAKEQIYTAQASDLGGGVINLSAGSYALGAVTENFNRLAATQWVTIQAKSGVPASSVILTTQGTTAGIRTSKLHLKNLTVSIDAGISTTTSINAALWLDGVTYSGSNKGLSTIYTTTAWQNGGIYCTTTVVQFAVTGCNNANLVSGSTFHDISGDAFTRSLAVIGSTSYNQSEFYTAWGAGTTNSGTLASGSPIITSVVDTGQFVVGGGIGSITNVEIPAATTITGINVDGANTLHMSKNAGSNFSLFSLTTGNHSDVYQNAGVALTVTSSSTGSNAITISAASIYARVGNAVQGTGITPGTYITGVTGGTSLTLSQNPTATLASITAYHSNILLLAVTGNYNTQSQGFFADSSTPTKDVAVVNSNFGNQTPGMLPSTTGLNIMQHGSTAINMVFANTTLNGPTIWRTDAKFNAVDVTLVNATCVSGAITNHSTTGVTYYGGTC